MDQALKIILWMIVDQLEKEAVKRNWRRTWEIQTNFWAQLTVRIMLCPILTPNHQLFRQVGLFVSKMLSKYEPRSIATAKSCSAPTALTTCTSLTCSQQIIWCSQQSPYSTKKTFTPMLNLLHTEWCQTNLPRTTKRTTEYPPRKQQSNNRTKCSSHQTHLQESVNRQKVVSANFQR